MLKGFQSNGNNQQGTILLNPSTTHHPSVSNHWTTCSNQHAYGTISQKERKKDSNKMLQQRIIRPNEVARGKKKQESLKMWPRYIV